MVEVPRPLQMAICGSTVRRALRETGNSAWPIGELHAEILHAFLNGLKTMRTENQFLKDQIDLANRVISLMELAIKNQRSVWLNF